MGNETNQLCSLGLRLRNERLMRNETQALFSARIGVSVPTLRKMETGDPTVQIGHWVAVLQILDREGDLDLLISPPEDMFAKYESINIPERRRAARKKRS